MLRLTYILGNASDPEIADALHTCEHHGTVEHISLDPADTARKRLRVTTDADTDCAITLSREERLENGSVLLLDAERAIVVRMEEEDWLDLRAADDAAALELGYLAGNMHWRVRFDGAVLKIALEGPEAGYLARLAPLLDSGRVRRAES